MCVYIAVCIHPVLKEVRQDPYILSWREQVPEVHGNRVEQRLFDSPPQDPIMFPFFVAFFWLRILEPYGWVLFQRGHGMSLVYLGPPSRYYSHDWMARDIYQKNLASKASSC